MKKEGECNEKVISVLIRSDLRARKRSAVTDVDDREAANAPLSQDASRKRPAESSKYLSTVDEGNDDIEGKNRTDAEVKQEAKTNADQEIEGEAVHSKTNELPFVAWVDSTELREEKRVNTFRTMSRRRLSIEARSMVQLNDEERRQDESHECVEEEGDEDPDEDAADENGCKTSTRRKVREKRQRALHLLKVMTRVFGMAKANRRVPGRLQLHPGQEATKEKGKNFSSITCVGTAELSVEGVTLAHLKKKFYGLTKNPNVLSDSLRIVCFDPVLGTESDVLTSTFLRAITNRFLTSAKDRYRETLQRVLSDFQYGLMSKSSSLTTLHAIYGVRLVASCPDNKDWDKYVTDSLLSLLLDFFSEPEQPLNDELASYENSFQGQAVMTLYVLSKQSSVIRSRLAALRAVNIVVGFVNDHLDRLQTNKILFFRGGQDTELLMVYTLALLVSCSLDLGEQGQIWREESFCTFLLHSLQFVSRSESQGFPQAGQHRAKIEQLIFQLVRNMSGALRGHLEKSEPYSSIFSTISRVLELMIHCCFKSPQCKTESAIQPRRVHDLVSTVANIAESLEIIAESRESCILDDLLDISLSEDVQKAIQKSQEKERHYYECLTLILAKLATARNLQRYQRKSCQGLFDLFSAKVFSMDAELFLKSSILESLVDGFAATTEDVLDERFIEKVAHQMLDCPHFSLTHEAIQSIAFNIARLRFDSNQHKLCRALVRRGAIETLFRWLDIVWEEKRASLQVLGALVTLTSFLKTSSESAKPDLVEKVINCIKMFQSSNGDWIRDSIVVASCSALLWNTKSSFLITTAAGGILRKLCAAYFRHTNPVWGQVAGAFLYSIVDHLENAAVQEKQESNSHQADEVQEEKHDDGIHNHETLERKEEKQEKDEEESKEFVFARQFSNFLVQQLNQCGVIIQVESKKGTKGSGAQEASGATSTDGTRIFGVSQHSFATSQQDQLRTREEATMLNITPQLPPVPQGSSGLLRATDKLIKGFISQEFQIDQEEHDRVRAFLIDPDANGSDAENSGDEASYQTAYGATEDKNELDHNESSCAEGGDSGHAGQKNLLHLARARCIALYYCLELFLDAVLQHTWGDKILSKLRAEATQVLFYIAEQPSTPAKVRLQCAKALYLLRDMGPVTEQVRSNIVRLLRIVGAAFAQNSELIRKECTKLVARILVFSWQRLRALGGGKFLASLAEFQLHGLLISSLRGLTTPASQLYCLSALHLLSESKTQQVLIAKEPEALHLLLDLSDFGSTKTDCSDPNPQDFVALMAAKLLLLLKKNPANVTPFYMCELKRKELRGKFHDWEDNLIDQGMQNETSKGWIKLHGDSVSIYTRKSASDDSEKGEQEEELEQGEGISRWFTTPVACLNSYLVFMSRRDVPERPSIQVITQDLALSEQDLLPAPRAASITTRMRFNVAWIRGPLRISRVQVPIDLRPNKPKMNPHAFLEPVSGRVKAIPLEFVFTEAQVKNETNSKAKTMHYLHESTQTIILEDEDDWDLEGSIFSARLNPALDAGSFWNSSETVDRVLEWDFGMCQKKPSFVRKISSVYSRGEIQTCLVYLKQHYQNILMTFLFYTTTERLEGMSLFQSCYNMFCLSRQQFWHFVEDYQLVEMAQHMTYNDFDMIYETIVTNHAPLSKQEARTNQETAIMKHGKRGSPMQRYQFVECLFLLADAIFMNAPSSSPLKMKHFCRALLHLIEICFKPLGDQPLLNADVFRHHHFYRPSIHKVFKRNARALREQLFNVYCASSPRSVAWGGTENTRMSILDWSLLLDAVGVLEYPSFSCIDSNFIFQQSILNTIDLVQGWRKACTLTFVSFLEAIARLSQYLLLPSVSNLHAFGVKTISSFYDLHHATGLWSQCEQTAFEGHDWIQSRLDPGTRSSDMGSALAATISQSVLHSDQVEATVELLLQAKVLERNRNLRMASWSQRLQESEKALDPSFDVQVAKDFFFNLRRCAKLKASAKASVPEVDHTPVKPQSFVKSRVVETMTFEDLVDEDRKELLLMSYSMCECIRNELDRCHWYDQLEQISMVETPNNLIWSGSRNPNKLAPPASRWLSTEQRDHSENESSESGLCSPFLYFKLEEETLRLEKTMIHNADALHLLRLSSKQFHLHCCKKIFDSWKTRNASLKLCQQKLSFDDLDDEDMKIEILQLVHVAVYRYTYHVLSFWNRREIR